MDDISRRRFMTGSASLALLPAFPMNDLVAAGQLAMEAQQPDMFPLMSELRHLIACYRRFLEIEHSDLHDPTALHEWQARYDRAVGAADALRHAITDDTVNADYFVFFAGTYIEPSCRRAILYRVPVKDMSSTFGHLANNFFAARAERACSIAQGGNIIPPSCRLIVATQLVRNAIPETPGDRKALKRVIESLNNDDMVDIAIARSMLDPHETKEFAQWARPCGRYRCGRCEEWLTKDGEQA